ncbi:60s acidic ribosomal protein domain-containing protein [Purpureocillium lavendulum]|uniref:60s acidic ribosomal protein domain-containing protein n=1 Tax=Purpureocillium lavendulum TaxID=1247861 RepID=A0AB34FZQ3_9HYPO|nr:60s acidic ribosomal protein domain-containing protein [Purpureocillium lavendulum]
MNRYVLFPPQTAGCYCGACPLPVYAPTDPNPAPAYSQATQQRPQTEELRGEHGEDASRQPGGRFARWWKRVAGAMTFEEQPQPSYCYGGYETMFLPPGRYVALGPKACPVMRVPTTSQRSTYISGVVEARVLLVATD